MAPVTHAYGRAPIEIMLMIIHLAQEDVIPTGQEDFFFAYALKNKAFHWAASKWFGAPYQWQYCYVSINHFETATATK